jgi:hypothetical protein
MGQARIKSTEYGYSRQKKVLAGIFCAAGAIGIGCGIAAGSFGGVGEASRQGASEISENQTGGRAVANAVRVGPAQNSWAKALSDTEALADRAEVTANQLRQEGSERWAAEMRAWRRLDILDIQRQYDALNLSKPTPYQQYIFLEGKMGPYVYESNPDEIEVREFVQRFNGIAREALNELVIKSRQGSLEEMSPIVFKAEVGCFDRITDDEYCRKIFEPLSKELSEYRLKQSLEQDARGQEAPEPSLIPGMSG